MYDALLANISTTVYIVDIHYVQLQTVPEPCPDFAPSTTIGKWHYRSFFEVYLQT